MSQRTEKKIGKRSQATGAKRQLILTAALAVFSQYGIHGARLEQVAERAGVSKTNLLYYYPSKEALYVAVMRQILDIWLAPLLMEELTGDLKALIDEKSALIAGWVHSGKLAPVSPHHLIFMIWAATQHYADFAPQVEAVTGATLRDEAFFNQTVESVQRIIIEGIRVR
ncbi:TetR family transcriptional regulator [Salmonella enterica]|nr:TetR family transcriptional regulator [Salmonella enterica]EAZ1554415.1 TetR family transcriptional regulator [Salmonella enterica]EBR1520029.1 TetR family transcriptional regulator [Salmonella enterica]EHA5401056.1 TetR family transcriptional regulator [Salmonella enterica]